MTKNGQKWPKSRVCGHFKKIMSLVFSGICVKQVLMVHKHFVKTACSRKIWFSSYSPKWLLANEISVFFNRQYFTNRLISDFDFWHVDWHEWKKQGSLTRFLKKILIWANGPFWAQKLRILITLDLLEEFFQKIFFRLGQMDFFGPKNGASS